ncbi:MAG TPA: helix-turn-helix domain-containing protein [Candidatus Dormibacteraeota bacterium]|nr:helix-turn-helix domain-containing protein [Candidatus Dormibacteraeota bacterium]
MGSADTDAPVATDAQPRRRRLPGVNLRPGAVKQARVEAGLSLAQLGRGHVTAPAIYLVETGRTRPSLPTLEHIARRTNKPVEFFLAEPAGAPDDMLANLIELEAMVADGRSNEAIAFGRSLLDRGTSAFHLGRIRFFLAQAHLATSTPDRAAPLLKEARAHFEAVNDGVMLAECLGDQAALANMTQSGDARALAEEALAVCRKLKPVPAPTEARLLGILATAYVAGREWESAIAAYEEAIAVGDTIFDLRRVARMYSGLGMAYHEVGAVEVATRYTMRSVALLEVLRDRVSLARSENNLALVLMARGDLAAARKHLDRSLQLCDESDLEFGRSHVLLSLCELAMQEGDVDRAAGLAQEALELAERLEEGASMAEAHVWLGRIAAGRGDDARADREFEDAIHGFEALGMRERLLNCHGVYAEILERRGELAKAYVHMKEALQASRPGVLRQTKPQEEKVNSA